MNTLHSRIRLVAAVMCLALVVFQTNFNLIVLAQEGDSGESASEVKPEEKPQDGIDGKDGADGADGRSEEHTSELQSHVNIVCRLLLEKIYSYWRSVPLITIVFSGTTHVKNSACR